MSAVSSFYEYQVFPWLNDKLCADPALQALRSETLAPARGKVVEIGFGSGLNLPHYPAGVLSLVGVEPNTGMHHRALPRIEGTRLPVQIVPGTAEHMPLPNAEFDTAVSVLTLCSVGQPRRALLELRRVLRDDGRLLLMEHGLAQQSGVARWQGRLNGVQKVLACGCNLNRNIEDLVRSSGFRFESMRQFYAPGIPRTHGWMTVASAVKA